MNWKHLLWIVPLTFMTGCLLYATLNVETERAFLPLVETCVGYETYMDQAIVLVQMHCLKDSLSENKNTVFCNEFMNQSKILSFYNWEFT